jgi:predicted RNA-binding protein YlxR (DUF448 family)
MTASPSPSAEAFAEQPPAAPSAAPSAAIDDALPGDPAIASGLRRCVASGAVLPKAGMIRFVVSPDGVLVPDLEEALPGRGLWLSADQAAAEKAFAKGLFAKAARRAVTVAPDLLERTRARLSQRCLEAVGLARRGGQAVAGFEKVAQAIRAGRIGTAGRVGLRLEAADAADDGRAKLDGLARGAQALSGAPLNVVDQFDRHQLGAAFGRDEVVHAIMGQGKLAERLLRDAARLQGLRGNRGSTTNGRNSND